MKYEENLKKIVCSASVQIIILSGNKYGFEPLALSSLIKNKHELVTFCCHPNFYLRPYTCSFLYMLRYFVFNSLSIETKGLQTYVWNLTNNFNNIFSSKISVLKREYRYASGIFPSLLLHTSIAATRMLRWMYIGASNRLQSINYLGGNP